MHVRIFFLYKKKIKIICDFYSVKIIIFFFFIINEFSRVSAVNETNEINRKKVMLDHLAKKSNHTYSSTFERLLLFITFLYVVYVLYIYIYR